MRIIALQKLGLNLLLGASLWASASASADGWQLKKVMNGFGYGVSGSGKLRTESRAVTAAIQAVDLRDSSDIEVRIGSPASLTIKADDNILPLISTDIEHGTLVIKATSSYRSHHSPKVILTVPSLGKLSIHGSGDAKLVGLVGDKLDLEISGSGNILAEGTVSHVDLSIDGSGDANLVALQAKSAAVEINGSGDVSLNVSDVLRAVVNGSGDISYLGNPPQVSKRVNGSGDISQR